MGTGASKSFDHSINALKVIKRMQKPPSGISDQSGNSNGALDQQKLIMSVGKAQNGHQSINDNMATAPKFSEIPDNIPEEKAEERDKIKADLLKATIKTLKEEDSGDEEVSKGDEKGKEDKALTEEEIRQQIDEYYEKMTSVISSGTSIPVRDNNLEEEPYTVEFRAFALKLGKSYFHFKIGVIPYSFVKEFRLKVAKFLCDSKCLERICDVACEGLNRRDFHNEEWETRTMFFLPLKNIVLSMLNYSDASRELKLGIGSHQEFLTSLLKIVNDWKDKHLQQELPDFLDKFLKWCVSIFHNCASVDENVPLLREIGVIQAVQPYLDSPVATMRLSAVSTLADIVNEEEAEVLQTNPSIYKFLLKTLKLSLTGPGHKNLGWSAEELTRAVRQLARNDANKKILVDLGCLPLLTELLEMGNETEVKEALDCLWILSFNDGNKKAMMCEEKLVDCVVQQYHQGCGSMKYSCHGLLWSLKDHLLSDDKYKKVGNEISSPAGQPGAFKKSPDSPDTPEKPNFEGHVMISYQWANQETIKHIARELRAHDIPIWLDIDYMGGSTLQAMARAVENSFAVIIAMSQKYKDSPNTRAEAEYAFQQRKTIIPLIMHQGYRPDGWLGLILGSKLYYDFSGKYSFESRMDGLLKAILNIQDAIDGNLQPEQPLMTMTKAPVLTSPTKPVARSVPLKEKEIKAWESDDVMQWLAKHKLDGVASMVKLSGEEILFLYKLKIEAPEFFYRCLEAKLKLESLLDLSRATEAIAALDA